MLLDGIEIFYDPLDIDAIAYYLSGAIMGSKHRLKLCIIVKCYLSVVSVLSNLFDTMATKNFIVKAAGCTSELKSTYIMGQEPFTLRLLSSRWNWIFVHIVTL